ncbi:MAG: metal-dependent hydrolase [Hyphomicrobiaceae bacterium]
MQLTWFGHSCFRVETGAAKILIDPFLTGNGTFEATGKSVAEASEGITHVILTHGHDDHVGDAVEICKSTGATLVTVYELAMYLNGQGVEKIDPANPGGTLHHDGFGVTFVNALHSSSTTVDGKPVYLGAACGVVIKPAEGAVLYHMGDTEVMSDFAIINDLHQPTVGIVPIGDRFTMGAKSAAFACRRFFRFETIVPCHYGTFPILDQTADVFVAEMSGHNVVVAEPCVVFSV